MNVSSISIFTGAGFTKNFGGYLSNEMWAIIFNDPAIQLQKNLRELLLSDMNFENVYSTVIESEKFSNEEQIELQGAIERAYRKLDEQISRFMPQRADYFDLDNMGKLAFLPSTYGGDDRAVWFTLNQDLFFERHRNWFAAGAPKFEKTFYQLPTRFTPTPAKLYPYDVSKEKLFSDLQQALKDHAGISYLKLHGSYCWQSWDGSPGMVLGMNKEALIEREPLLKCYFEYFRWVLSRGGQKLLIIGYGFRDKHINKLFLENIQQNGLKLYVIDPTDPEIFKTNLMKSLGSSYEKIWNAVHGYFPYRLKDIFYENTETVPWREIKAAIHGK